MPTPTPKAAMTFSEAAVSLHSEAHAILSQLLPQPTTTTASSRKRKADYNTTTTKIHDTTRKNIIKGLNSSTLQLTKLKSLSVAPLILESQLQGKALKARELAEVKFKELTALQFRADSLRRELKVCKREASLDVDDELGDGGGASKSGGNELELMTDPTTTTTKSRKSNNGNNARSEISKLIHSEGYKIKRDENTNEISIVKEQSSSSSSSSSSEDPKEEADLSILETLFSQAPPTTENKEEPKEMLNPKIQTLLNLLAKNRTSLNKEVSTAKGLRDAALQKLEEVRGCYVDMERMLEKVEALVGGVLGDEGLGEGEGESGDDDEDDDDDEGESGEEDDDE